MKLFICLFACFFSISNTIRSQNIAINNDGSLPTPGAMLDVKSGNKGILIPRLALTGTDDVTTIPTRPTSLIIYNSNSTVGLNAVSPGFYYWNGATWIRFTTNSSSLLSGWLQGGNSGTSPATHFIGTTDNNSLLFKVNGEKAGYVGKQQNDGNVFWGYQSGYNNVSGYSNVSIGIRALFSNTTSSHLVALGDSALYSNTDGIFNTSIGSKSLFTNTSANGNTAIGAESLYSTIFGSYNTAVGLRSLYSTTTGENNSAFGQGSLQSNTSGIENVALGASALFTNDVGSFNTAIGATSMFNNTSGQYNIGLGSSSLLDNGTGNDNIGIGRGSDVLTGNLSNAVAIGSFAKVGCDNCMVLGNNMNIGIRNSYPGFPLNFGPTLGDKISLYGNAGAHYGFGIQPSLLQIHTDISTADIAFGYGSSGAFAENFRVKGNGDVLLGTSTVTATLTFGQSLSKKIILFHGGSGGDAGFGVFPNELRIHSDYSGAAVTFGYDATTGFTENMRIQGNGNLQVRGTVTANSSLYTSDVRFKKNITLINSGLEKILLLNAYHYNWKDEANDPYLQTGVLAQEVQKVFPELVREDNRGYLSVNYVGLIPYLIQSVREQQDQINNLKKENEELKKMKSEWDGIKKKILERNN